MPPPTRRRHPIPGLSCCRSWTAGSPPGASATYHVGPRSPPGLFGRTQDGSGKPCRPNRASPPFHRIAPRPPGLPGAELPRRLPHIRPRPLDFRIPRRQLCTAPDPAPTALAKSDVKRYIKRERAKTRSSARCTLRAGPRASFAGRRHDVRGHRPHQEAQEGAARCRVDDWSYDVVLGRA